jgi:hypothetical protein
MVFPLSTLGSGFSDLSSGRPHAFRRAERGGRAPDPRPWAELRQGAAGGEPGRDPRARAGEEPGFADEGRRARAAPQPLFRSDQGCGRTSAKGKSSGRDRARARPRRDPGPSGMRSSLAGRRAFRSLQSWTVELALWVRRFAPRQAIVTLQAGDRLRASSPAEAGDRARSRRVASTTIRLQKLVRPWITSSLARR